MAPIKSRQLWFLFGFILTLSLSAWFFNLVVSSVAAATVNINATVSAGSCGDGIISPGEQCDGNAGGGACDPSKCQSNCQCAVCHNGIKETGEECDSTADCPGNDTCNSECKCEGGPATCTFVTCNATNWGTCTGIPLTQLGTGTDNCGRSCTTSRLCCVPTVCDVTSWQACVGLIQIGTGTDDCGRSCTTTRACLPGCNDGIIQTPREQCDETTANGVICVPPEIYGSSCQYCSSICQWQLVRGAYCGDSVRQLPEEQCDQGEGNGEICLANDYNSQCIYCSGLCQSVTVLGPHCGDAVINGPEECDPPAATCLASCRNQLAIINPRAENVTLNSATILWQTNLSSTASLDWQDVTNGGEKSSVDNLSGVDFSYQLTGLHPGARYVFKITAVRGDQQVIVSDSFFTSQLPLCPNGVCDLNETPVTCPQDCVLPCQPEWAVGPWSECVDGIQTRQYSNLNPDCPYPITPPPDQRCCLPNCNVTCGLCQHLDVASQSCSAIWPCCGDRICEPPQENRTTCPIDCAIPPPYIITLPQCLDGRDNDDDGLVDYPADPDCTAPSANSELGFLEGINRLFALLNKPVVEKANEQVAAPALIALAAINTFATFSFFNFLNYLRYIFTQPLAVLGRRKRQKWGVVYNALSKQPVDLAIVRLYRKDNGQLIQSRVTDKNGRYNFIAAPGRYYITVTKPKFTYPTFYLKDKKEDVKYLDLYHGETFEIAAHKGIVVFNIPLDPHEDTRPPSKIVFQYYARKVQYAAAFSAVPLAALSLAISPSLFTVGLLVLHILLYIFFKQLGYQRPPKSWGVVYDKTDSKPVGLVITRIYDKQYNKLLESRVTDAKGRYAFLVDNNVYVVTAEKIGYKPSKIDEINLVDKKQAAIVAMNIPIEKGAASLVGQVAPGTNLAAPVLPAAATPTAPSLSVGTQPVEPTSAEVGRGSLEELLKTKQQVGEIKKQIDQEQAQLEKLEAKADQLAASLTEKIGQQPTTGAPAEISTQPLSGQPSAVSKPALPPPAETKPSEPKNSIFG